MRNFVETQSSKIVKKLSYSSLIEGTAGHYEDQSWHVKMDKAKLVGSIINDGDGLHNGN